MMPSRRNVPGLPVKIISLLDLCRSNLFISLDTSFVIIVGGWRWRRYSPTRTETTPVSSWVTSTRVWRFLVKRKTGDNFLARLLKLKVKRFLGITGTIEIVDRRGSRLKATCSEWLMVFGDKIPFPLSPPRLLDFICEHVATGCGSSRWTRERKLPRASAVSTCGTTDSLLDIRPLSQPPTRTSGSDRGTGTWCSRWSTGTRTATTPASCCPRPVWGPPPRRGRQHVGGQLGQHDLRQHPVRRRPGLRVSMRRSRRHTTRLLARFRLT